MKITSITLSNFHCFGPEPTTVLLSDLTTLIGPNGCGKTAVLQALSRIFGVSKADRGLRLADFHVPADKSLDDLNNISLFVEVRIDFPGLDAAPADGSGVPECFNQMLVDAEGATPYCRVRLEGTWTRTNLPGGDIDEQICWITTPKQAISDSDRHRIQGHERSRIHVIYIPAIRDPTRQINQASGAVLARLLRAVNWSAEVQQQVEQTSDAVATSLRSEQGVKHIEGVLASVWKSLQDFPGYSEVALRPLENRLVELLRRVEVFFGSEDRTDVIAVDRLSDGLRSLFYFALIVAGVEVEHDAARRPPSPNGSPAPFAADQIDPPDLVIFAVEEPENHLAPHYLGRIFSVFERVAKSSSSQVVFTSHSPAILSRVDPVDVRYLRLQSPSRTTTVRNITLPDGEADAYKYIKAAVRAYPELYFARLVVLGEGDSEEIVVPRLAAACGVPIDLSFVSVVPLGGRHVNHFWKLLHDLSIPHITLLDLDRERDGGGWSRVHYACTQLQAYGVPRDELFSVTAEGGKTRVLHENDVAGMTSWTLENTSLLDGWLQMLEEHDVFFAAPLDLDFAMCRAFPTEYEQTAVRGPRIPTKPSPEYDERIKAAVTATLKTNNTGGATYTDDEHHAFIWYSYLFLGKGKPTTHILALSKIADTALKANAPPVLLRLVNRIRDMLAMEERIDAKAN